MFPENANHTQHTPDVPGTKKLKKKLWALAIMCGVFLALTLVYLEAPLVVKPMSAQDGGQAAPLVAVAPVAPAGSLAVDPYTNNPIAGIAERCSPAVVNIDTEAMVKQQLPFPFNDPTFREFFGKEFDQFNRTVPMRGKGSGFIVSPEGYILTNHHVVAGADKITVTLLDGRHFPATLIGKDPTFDLAVIQIKAKDLPVLPMGDSDATRVGEWVVAIGNPLGFENTVTVGVVSGKNRTLQAADVNFQGFMQTDAAINPGNSGGPLINLNGEAIAINTAIVPYAQGIGFAVPVNMAKQIMNDLIKHGEVKRGWLGVSIQTMTPAFAEAYKIPVKEGAVVGDVMRTSPAEKAGLARGDVIVSIAGKPVKSGQDVVLQIRNALAGEKVEIEFYRGAEKQKTTVQLDNIPSDGMTQTPKGSSQKPSTTEGVSSKQLGAAVANITPQLRNRYRIAEDVAGVVLIDAEANSPLRQMGLQQGDVIMEVNRRKVTNIGEWDAVLGAKPKAIAMLVWRQGQTLFLSWEKP